MITSNFLWFSSSGKDSKFEGAVVRFPTLARGATRGRITQLDGLRGFAFLSLFLSTATGFPDSAIAGDLFLLLSGYFITDVLLSSKNSPEYFGVFFARRFLRLVSSTLPAVIFSLILFGKMPINIWSCLIVAQFYLIWPIIVDSSSERSLSRLCLAMLIAAPFFRWLVTLCFSDLHLPYSLFPCRLDVLAAGALVAQLKRSTTFQLGIYSRLSILGATLAFLVFNILALIDPSFAASSQSKLYNVAGLSLIGVGLLGLLSYVLLLRGGLVYRLLTAPPIRLMGVGSLAMVISHEVIFREVVRLGYGGVTTSLISLGASAAWSILSWYLVESRVKRFKERHFVYSVGRREPTNLPLLFPSRASRGKAGD